MRRSARRALASAYDALSSGVATVALVRALEAPTYRLPDGPPDPPLNTALAARRRLPATTDDWRVGAGLTTGMRPELLARLEAHDVLFIGIAQRLDRVFELFRTVPPPIAGPPRESRLAQAVSTEITTLTRG